MDIPGKRDGWAMAWDGKGMGQQPGNLDGMDHGWWCAGG